MGRSSVRITQMSIVLLIAFFFIVPVPTERKDGLILSEYIKSSTDHSTIHFDNNADIAIFPNKTGNGTEEDPYIIQDIEIDTKGVGIPIVLFNINAHLVLQNITVRNGQKEGPLYQYFGIDIDQSENIDVIDCIIINNSWGISLDDSNECNIHQNSVLDNEIGIVASRANNINISINYLSGNDIGIQIISARESNVVYNNTLIDNNEGIILDGGALSTRVIKNYVTKCVRGIGVYGLQIGSISMNTRVYQNIVHENDIGIELSYTNENHIVQNIISNNGLGLKLEKSDDNTFAENQFLHNQRNLEKIDSHHNGLILLKVWQLIAICSSGGVILITTTIFALLFNPKNRRRVLIKKKMLEGELLKSEGNNEKAIECFNTIITLDSSKEIALNKKIAILYELKRYKEISEILKGKSNSQEEPV